MAAVVPGGNDTLALQILAGFQRVALGPGQSTVVTFNLDAGRVFGHVAASGDVGVAAGGYEVVVHDGGAAGAGAAAAAAAASVRFPVRVSLPAGASDGFLVTQQWAF